MAGYGPDQYTCYPVVWAKLSTLLNTREKRTVAICGYSGRIFKIATSPLLVLVVNDLYASPKIGRCEEERRCLDFDCPLNKTTWKSLLQEGEFPKGTRRPKAWANKGKLPTISYNLQPDGTLHDFSDLVVGRERGGYLMSKGER